MNKIIVEFIPATRWWKRATWKLMQDYVSANNEVTVPRLFITDGASIPFFARLWFSPTGEYFGAAIVHDYVLASTKDWKKANHQFWQELKALGVNNLRKLIMLNAVRVYYYWLKLIGKA